MVFVAGTQIRRPNGDVPVETLQVGDLVLTSSGEARPVKWIGHRDVDCRRYPDPTSGHPVRIAADAFGPNRPSQDLFVSNGHGICLDLCGEVLIPVGYLINGATIATAAIDEVSYWHVELDSHDILIANNLPAETYMDMDNRAFFEDETVGLEGLDRSNGKTDEDFCRPVAIGGQVLAFARERLIARAEAIGWTPGPRSASASRWPGPPSAFRRRHGGFHVPGRRPRRAAGVDDIRPRAYRRRRQA